MSIAGLLLFHGAGGDRDHRLFVEIERRLDIPVTRCNFPYRDKGPGRRPPDRMPKLVESIKAKAEAFAAPLGAELDSIVFGGRSMGGRACSMAVAEGMEAAGLVLLSYPLHPPGKPDKLRVEHFGEVGCPVLLVQGESDPFGKPDEFAQHLPSLGGPVTECWLPKTGHDPKPAHDETIITELRTWLAGLA